MKANCTPGSVEFFVENGEAVAAISYAIIDDQVV